MLLFQNQGTCYVCGKTGHRANEYTSRKSIIQIQKITDDFMVNA
jgi:hypothetical protein